MSRILELTAILRPDYQDDIRDAFHAAGIAGMTISEVKGYGRQFGHTELYRGAEYETHFLPKMQFVVLLPEGRLAEAVAILKKLVRQKAAGRRIPIGEGIMYVKEVLEATRLRTEEPLFLP